MDDIIIETDIDPDYVPTAHEIEQYALWIGMDPVKDKHLLWIAKDGIKVGKKRSAHRLFTHYGSQAPLPTGWKEVRTKETDEVYYYNFETVSAFACSFPA